MLLCMKAFQGEKGGERGRGIQGKRARESEWNSYSRSLTKSQPGCAVLWERFNYK